MATKEPSIAGIAREIGKIERERRDVTDKVRKFTRRHAPPAKLREIWMVNHLMGDLDISKPKAMDILIMGRNLRSAINQKAYGRASMQFSYHILGSRKRSASRGDR